jgi:hypothetical protein
MMGPVWKLSAFALFACLCAVAQTAEGTVIDSTYRNPVAGTHGDQADRPVSPYN